MTVTAEDLAKRGVRARPLQWVSGDYMQMRAYSPLGEVVITRFGGRWHYQGIPFPDMPAAQAAAEADHAARILAALECAPDALVAEAEARGMERAAALHDAEIVKLEAQIEENNAYLRRRHGEAGAYAHASEANDYCRTQITVHRVSAADIRAEAASLRAAKPTPDSDGGR